MINIHKTTIVHKDAQIADDVKIGPFCNIEKDVVIDCGTTIHSNVSILVAGDKATPTLQIFCFM